MRALIAVSCSLLIPMLLLAQPPEKPVVGERAPEFSLRAATKDSILQKPVDLTGLSASGPVIIAFYPADWSGGCTTEMCSFRDTFADLAGLGVTVVGISGDYVYSHRAWAKELNLPFMLLSDHDHAVASAYGSYNAATGYNFRTVFVVDRAGTVAYADRAFKAGSGDSYQALSAALKGIPR